MRPRARRRGAEFSFFLAMPTMVAAAAKTGWRCATCRSSARAGDDLRRRHRVVGHRRLPGRSASCCATSRRTASTSSPGTGWPLAAAGVGGSCAERGLAVIAVAAPIVHDRASSSPCRSSSASRRWSGSSTSVDGVDGADLTTRLLGPARARARAARHAAAGPAGGRRGGDQRDRAPACCARAEHYLMLVPVFRTIYAPVKQLIAGVFAGQRVGLQAGGDGRAIPAAAGAGLPDQGVHGATADGAPEAAGRRSTCRPITSIWGTS